MIRWLRGLRLLRLEKTPTEEVGELAVECQQTLALSGLGILFLLGSVIAWLRFDGMKIPQFNLPRIKRTDPAFLTSDMADHIDDDIVKFDDLDKEEQDVCVLLTDLLLAAVCLLLALFL